MDIDLNILRSLEREKEISFDVLVEAIEQALLTAYQKTPGAAESARVVLDRKSGHVTVLADEVDDEGEPVTGRITASDDEGAVLDVEGTEQRFAYTDVKKAKIQIEFKKEVD